MSSYSLVELIRVFLTSEVEIVLMLLYLSRVHRTAYYVFAVFHNEVQEVYSF